MGGRGKSSGAAKRPATTSAKPINFGDPGAITLEQLEAAAKPRVTPADVARGVEEAMEQMLTAPPDLYAKHEAGLERTLARVAKELKARPAEERRAFSEALEPLLGRLREQAEGRSS